MTILEWLPAACVAWWKTHGYTADELEQGVVASRLTTEDVTDLTVFDGEPKYVPEGKKELRRKNVQGWRHLHEHFKGHDWTCTEPFWGDEYRVMGKFAHLKYPRLTHALLKMRIPWFDEFKWDIYGYPGERSMPERLPYEIYLKVNIGTEYCRSIYCPVHALLSGDRKPIVDRCTSYAKSYNNELYTSALLKAVECEEAIKMYELLEGKVAYVPAGTV